MNILEIFNLAGLFFLLGWILSQKFAEKEIRELQDICMYYYEKNNPQIKKRRDK